MLVVEDKENTSYAIRVKMQNPAMMLRKIVNHPYLVQYPLEPGTPYARIDEELVKTSGKLLVLDAMLQKLKERGHKVSDMPFVCLTQVSEAYTTSCGKVLHLNFWQVLLFSTFTILIDILEDYLSLRSYQYFRLDGSTSLEDRQTYIKKFNSDPDMFLFLISTRAGGLGINLASADTVILFDSDWVRILSMYPKLAIIFMNYIQCHYFNIYQLFFSKGIYCLYRILKWTFRPKIVAIALVKLDLLLFTDL